MVKGLEKFKEHFSEFNDQYILIGGTACSVALEQAGLDFRATKDLDIVLYVEALSRQFGERFWSFIEAGGYRNFQRSGKQHFYRFDKPTDKTFPYMLELFSRNPDILKVPERTHLTPIPIDEEVSSLSAILLDEDYYKYIIQNRLTIDNLSIVRPECIIPLKAKAWLDLSRRKSEGEDVDEKDIRKHRNDVFRMFQLLTLEREVQLPDSVKKDLKMFVAQTEPEDINVKQLGLRNTTAQEVLANIEAIFKLT